MAGLLIGGCVAACEDDGGSFARASPTHTAEVVATVTQTATPTDAATFTRTSPSSPTPAPSATGTVSVASPTASATPQGRCDHFDPLRNVYFGDLHVHTAYSFDAYVFDVRTTPADAYRFARGEEILVPPLDAEGQGTQGIRLARPLDFAAVTDHSEFLGEVDVCTVAGAPGYDSPSCAAFRAGGSAAQGFLGLLTAMEEPERIAEICGAGGEECRRAAASVWQRTIDAAEQAYDRSAACAFTAFVAYEYTANTGASSQHRNVVFRSASAPLPISYIEQPTARGLWRELRAACLPAEDCDVLAIPHNSNQSNGRLFLVEYENAGDAEAERAEAGMRSAIEPLVEIYQHKGDSECMNGLSGIAGAPDEFCGFEKLRAAPFEDCRDGVGNGGTANGGCISRRDFARGALLEGLREGERIGANPLRLGFVAGTDTHGGTAGAVAEDGFVGHRGNQDDMPEERLATGAFRSGVVFSPGGLTGVWAEENTRESIFDALRRRETFGTSGPRIAVRLFGGWELASDLCGDPAMIARADAFAVPMGAVLPAPPPGANVPSFLVAALGDPASAAGLERIQIVKGWVENGAAHQRVFDVAGQPGTATIDPQTCVATAPGASSLCAFWRDPEFDAERHAFYYARVLENPSCRWTAFDCNRLPAEDGPPACDDPSLARLIRERAWSSPIWYEP